MFQMAFGGTHSRIVSRNAAIHHIIVKAPATRSVIRNHLLTKEAVVQEQHRDFHQRSRAKVHYLSGIQALLVINVVPCRT